MLTWHRELWLIDFGASLYFHHTWNNWQQQILQPFSNIKSHVLLAQASELEEADRLNTAILTPQVIEQVIDLIPDEWLFEDGPPAEMRQVYNEFLNQRIASSYVFVNEAQHARAALI
jgi:hypothetical protein